MPLIKVFLILSACLSGTFGYASSPLWTITPFKGNPTRISISVTEQATIRYLVTNRSRKHHLLKTRPIPGITSSGCSSILKSLKSCILTLHIKGSSLQGNIIGGPQLCQSDRNRLPNPNQCYQPNQRDRLIITLSKNAKYTVTPRSSHVALSPSTPQTVDSGSTQKFTVTPNAGYLLSNTVGGTCPTGTWNKNVYTTGPITNSCSVYFTARQTGYAYVLQEERSFGPGDQVMFCTINRISGLLENCQPTAQSLPGGLFLRGVAVDKDATTAYFTSQNDSSVYQCTIAPTTKLLENCTQTIINYPGFNIIYGQLAVNSSNTKVYIVDDLNQKVLSCPIINQTIQGNCTAMTSFSDFHGVGIALNPSNTLAFLGNYFVNYIYTCSIDSQGVFKQCIEKTGDGTLNLSTPTDVVVNKSGTILYATTGQGIVGCDARTTVNTSTFNSCFIAKSLGGFSLALHPLETFAYITDNNASVYVCPIEADGTFGNCSSQSGFQYINDIVLF